MRLYVFVALCLLLLLCVALDEQRQKALSLHPAALVAGPWLPRLGWVAGIAWGLVGSYFGAISLSRQNIEQGTELAWVMLIVPGLAWLSLLIPRARTAALRGLHLDPQRLLHIATFIAVMVCIQFFIVELLRQAMYAGVDSAREDVPETLTRAALYAASALLGVAAYWKRGHWPAVRARLGLGAHRLGALVSGLGAGIALGALCFAVGSLGETMGSGVLYPPPWGETTSDWLLWVASLMVLAAAIELLLRGALQPRIGIFWTSLVALFLSSPILVPGWESALFLAVPLVLICGWLAKRQGTLAAVVAHATCCFVTAVLLGLL